MEYGGEDRRGKEKKEKGGCDFSITASIIDLCPASCLLRDRMGWGGVGWGGIHSQQWYTDTRGAVFVYLNPFICTARFRFRFERLVVCFTVFLVLSQVAVACSAHIVALI